MTTNSPTGVLTPRLIAAETEANPRGEVTLVLSAHDFLLVKHALAIAGNVVEDRRGTQAAYQYDELHERLDDLNDTWLCSTCGYTLFDGHRHEAPAKRTET